MVTIEELMRIAKDNGASDVHITVGIPPKMRVAGALTDMDFPRFLPNDTSEIIKSIMNERQLEILNEKGEVDFSFSIPSLGRYRINVFNQRGSLAAAIRLVGTTVPKPEELGLPKSVVDLYSKKRGLVLVTGPTGSGKSTTLASLVDKINENISSHIITLEDPIEYLHHHKKAMVNQREIGIDSMTYANALRAALREDPDVILVGEMRDLETISIAITAAETGHLVFPRSIRSELRVRLTELLTCFRRISSSRFVSSWQWCSKRSYHSSFCRQLISHAGLVHLRSCL